MEKKVVVTKDIIDMKPVEKEAGKVKVLFMWHVVYGNETFKAGTCTLTKQKFDELKLVPELANVLSLYSF